VLVTVIVLAVGLLGLAALQGTSLRAGTSSNYRSQATSLAYYIIDCMRVNRAAAITGAYDSPIPTTLPACTAGTVSALSGSTIAEKDVDAWRSMLACLLPQGTGAIAHNATTVTVTVQWDDSHGEQTPQQFTTATNL
jgi:type IV pilus assembly protein PilV